jgi:Uma2 family endonuclease
MSIADRIYTAEELLYFPSDCHYELVRGKLREMSPTGGEHGYSTSKTGSRIDIYVEENDLGLCFAAETGFLVAQNPDMVLAPDFAFIAKNHLTQPITDKFIPIIPDLVIETRSPSDSAKRITSKVQEWLDAGVRMILEINPKKKLLTVYRPGKKPQLLSSGDTFSGDDVLPGFELAVSKLFL